ncbi:MAG: glycosyltransferase family 2 protein [Bacteroidetes bacterium]|nr:MAG: glycosyltransferase family 2 protein [Bacteroidota bacterium]
MTNLKVFIIIPSYNEGVVLKNTILSLPKEYNIVVVDDCSKVSSAEMLEGTSVYYLRHEINLGQGAALQTGMDFAIKNKADIIIHFDADGQHDKNDIPKFIDKLIEGNYDIVLGSRFLDKMHIKSVPKIKIIILKIAIFVNGLLTGMWLSDAHNGFRAMTSKAASLIYFKENRMAHASEILLQIKKHKFRFTEISTHIVYTDHSMEKGQPWHNSLNILIDLIVNKILK